MYDRAISLLHSNPTFFLKSIFMKVPHFLGEKMKYFKMFCNFTPGIGPFSGKNQPYFTKKSTLTGLNTTFFHNKLFLSSLTIIVQSFRGCGTILEMIWLKKFKFFEFFRKIQTRVGFFGWNSSKMHKIKKFFLQMVSIIIWHRKNTRRRRSEDTP